MAYPQGMSSASIQTPREERRCRGGLVLALAVVALGACQTAEGLGLFRSEPVKTSKTKKTQRPIVLYDATEHHPAQTQIITDDVVIGHWTTTKFSGAIPRPKKRVLLERIRKLEEAVKFAREQANSMEADEKKVGQKVLDFIFKEG